MNRRNPVRYDPLYRVIDETDEMRFIEGTFKELFDNLKGINNLGIIPEVLEMAKYSKYEHHSGVMYQINSLLECVDKEMIPERYRLPLKLSALLLHVGHLPFTYSTERSLLVAANLSDKVKDAIEKKIQKVLKESGFKAKKKKKHFEALFSLKKYKVIYKYFSAYEVIDNWGKLKNKYSLIDIKKRVIINNMIDYEDSDGYNFLLLVDKADFVQRDALYFGTARIDISPKHLYGRSLVKLESEFSVDEKNLIESNLRYLKGRFYEDYEVRWFTRLYEKIVASLIISNNFKLDWLKEFNDLEFKELITENITPQNRKAGLPPTWTERAMALFKRKIQFSLIFNLSEISFENQSGIDLEYKLLQKDPSKRGVLSYPFDKGILLDIDYNEETKYPIYSDSQSFSVGVFQDTSNKKFIELLKIVKQLSYYCSISHVDNIRKGLCRQFSWTGSARIDNDAVIEVIAKVIQNIEKSPQEKGKFMENFFTNILEIKTFDELWHNFENSFIWLGEIKQLRKAKYLFDSYKLLVKGILNLPVRLLHYKHTYSFIDKIYNEIIKQIPNESNDKKGDYFEALWFLNRLRDDKTAFRFLISGMVVVDPTKPKFKIDENEFDVIDLFINRSGKAECWIYACSIAGNYRDNNEEKLKKLAKTIHDRYPDLIIRARYVIPKDKARNNWSPEVKETGVGTWN